jgi:hypothetical protein
MTHFSSGEKIQVHNLATAFARVFANSFRPRTKRAQRDPQVRAQGRPGARCTRGLMCQDAHSKKRTRAYRFSGSSPAFPAQWLYGLYRALPGETWLACHRRPQEARASCEFDTCHRGVRTTRLCHTLQLPSSVAAFASTASHRTFRDVRNAPLIGWDGNRNEADLPSRSSSTAATHWHDGQLSKMLSRSNSWLDAA